MSAGEVETPCATCGDHKVVPEDTSTHADAPVEEWNASGYVPCPDCGVETPEAAVDPVAQKVMIVQVPSEANAERLICERINDANAQGWMITQMMDHNGFLVLLLARAQGWTPPGDTE